MSDTHINAFIQDVEDAFKQVLAAVHDYHEKVESLKGKVAQEATNAGVEIPGLTVPTTPVAPAEIAEESTSTDQSKEEETTTSTDTANTSNQSRSSNKS